MKVTVKTLDSGCKEFEVTEELTVEELKDEILKEMSIPLHLQRLIFQGKPLKDEMKLKDCGVDGKVIHLVKRPPPSATRETNETATPETTPTTGAVPVSDTATVVTESTQTILLPGGMPTHTALTQVTQNIVDRIVSTLTSHGANAEVSAETITTDSSGTMRRATVSARSDTAQDTDPPPTQPSESTTTTSTTSTSEKSAPTEMEVDDTSTEPSAAATPASGSTSLAAVQEEEVKEKPEEAAVAEDEETREARRRRNRNKNHTMYNHAKTVKRCLDFANRTLNRYDRGSARVKAKLAAEKRGESGEELPVESWPEVEPMDVLESADGPSEEAKAGAGPASDDSDSSDPEIRGNFLIIKRDKKSRKNQKEPLDERYAILEDEDMPDLHSQFYAVLMEDLQAVHRRLSPLMDEYQRNAKEDRELTDTESVLAAQVALTVRDCVYYIGHGNVSLARLHINFLTPPPRVLRLAAPHKTEVRRVMMSMRRCFPSMHRMHEPSGYIVDISRDNEGGGDGAQGSGERRTTRAVVNRSQMNVGGGMPGYGGIFGPMLGGILGGRRRFMPSARSEPRPVPVPAPPTSTSTPEASGSGPPQASAAHQRPSALKKKFEQTDVVLKSVDEVVSTEPCEAVKKAEDEYMEGWEKLSEEEIKKREKRNKRLAEQKAMRDKINAESYYKDVEDMKKEDERWKMRLEEEKKKEEEEKEKKRKEEEERRKEEERKREEEERKKREEEEARKKREEEERKKREEEERKKREEEEAKKAEAIAQGNGSQEQGGEGMESTPTAEGEGGGEKKDDETPRYLARLLSELITGVADPAGPHRSTINPGGGAAPDVASTSANASSAGEGEAEEKKEEGEQPPRKSFAERYAGPEGTTVTIQAAPTAPFGLPMEGPSLSIRNPGAGAEPEMTINFPVPPAIHLLQSLLERAEERHRERQANGESSSSSSSDDDGDDEGEGGPSIRVKSTAAKDGDDKKKKKKERTRPHIPRPFIDDDGEVGSTSEAGELDSMDSDNEGPTEFNNRSMAAGEHMTMLEAMREVRGKIGMNPENESEDEEERHVNTLEQFLKMISRELKVKEVMKILQGDVGCLERTQPNFQEYIKDRLLDGAEATKERKDQALCRFLEHVQPSMEAIEASLPVRDTRIDMVETICKLLYYLLDELYDHIISSCTLREQVNKVFAKRLQKWAKESIQLFACAIRHCVDGDHLFDDMISKLVAQLFPPSTPKNILHVCIDSILKWLDRARKEARIEALELDRFVYFQENCKGSANYSYPLRMFIKEDMRNHDRLEIPYPPRESCPGGDEGEETGAAAVDDGVPAGVPEEWVSTIARDSEAHPKREGPQQPYSDAYLSGMPAKKRKLDTSEPCTKNTQDFLYEAMEYALGHAGVTTSSGATDAQMLSLVHHCPFTAGGLSANVHECHHERLQAAGATVEQYPHAMEFYHLDPETHNERLDK